MQRQMNSMSVGSGGFGSRLLEQHYQQQLDTNLEQTELESCQVIAKGHQPMMIVLSNRHRNLQVVYNLWQNKDAKVRSTDLRKSIKEMFLLFSENQRFDF